MDTAKKFKLNFDVDRTPEAAHIKELGEHVQRLEEVAQINSSSRVEKSNSSTLEQTNIEQRTNPVEEDNEEPEPDVAPLLCKRKRSVLARRVRRCLVLIEDHNPLQQSKKIKRATLP